MPTAPRHRCLARAGWALVHSSSKTSLDSGPKTPLDARIDAGPPLSLDSGPKTPLGARVDAGPALGVEAEGARLVAEVAACWSHKYIHTIRNHGAHGGAFHYECLFSCPTRDVPVPAFAISVRFAVVALPSGDGAASPTLRLMYSFEESDLRHEWALEKDARGRWRASRGQQPMSLNIEYFEKYLDYYVCEKEKVRSRGISVATPFEVSRLQLPPKCDDQSDDGAEELRSDEAEASGYRIVLPGEVPGDWEPGLGSPSRQRPQEDARQDDMANAIRQALKLAGLECSKTAPPASVTELLTNIFDAADEENVGELPHYEVARLLGATLPGFGLAEWDIQTLLMSAQENDDGFIALDPLISAAPALIQELRRRRISFAEQGLPGVEVSPEIIKYCFGDEVMLTTERLLQAFEQCGQDGTTGRYFYIQQAVLRKTRSSITITTQDLSALAKRMSIHSKEDLIGNGLLSPRPTGADGEERVLVALRRKHCRDCLLSLPERVSPQEAERLMQALPEDEDGFVDIQDFHERLEQLRMDTMLNAVVENDLEMTKSHLLQCFKDAGVDDEGKMKLWAIKQALLRADQLCLSRLHIHVLLCLAEPDSTGKVTITPYLALCCVMVQHMFNAQIFVETAERLQLEHAERTRHNENAELAALGAARVDTLGQGGEEKSQEIEVDQETVERTLIQVFSLSDETRENPPTMQPEVVFELLRSSDAQVQSCQLSEFEICGFAAEMSLDENGRVAYVDHVKRWVPTVFELRKHELLGAYLQEDAAETLGIPEPKLLQFENLFPKLTPAALDNPDGPPSGRTVRRMGSKKVPRQSSLEDRHSLYSTPRGEIRATPSRLRTVFGARMGSLSAEHSRSSKEPPPGRGFHRRKTRMASQQGQPPPSAASTVQG